jgi:hypothetical protein
MKNVNIQKWRVRQELKLNILKLIMGFKSKEESDYKKLTPKDIIWVMTDIIKDKI